MLKGSTILITGGGVLRKPGGEAFDGKGTEGNSYFKP